MRERKPRAYLEPKIVSYGLLDMALGFKPKRSWEARDYCGHLVAWGDTRKECEDECRYYGYVPERR